MKQQEYKYIVKLYFEMVDVYCEKNNFLLFIVVIYSKMIIFMKDSLSRVIDICMLKILVPHILGSPLLGRTQNER